MSAIHGLHVSEAMELLIVFVLFIGSLASVYLAQRWISGDEYFRK